MRPLSRIHLGAALCGLALCSAPAQATPITLTFKGTITNGYDYRGEFGAANTSLDGLSVVSAYTFDAGHFGTAAYSDTGHQTITVNGQTRQYDFSPYELQTYSYASRNLSEYGQYNPYSHYYYYWYSNYDQLYQGTNGYLNVGGYLQSYDSIYSYTNPLNIPYTAVAPWSHSVQDGDYSYMGFTRYNENWNTTAYYYGTVNSVSLATGASFAGLSISASNNVPEPAALGLACLALVGAGLARRRALGRRMH